MKLTYLRLNFDFNGIDLIEIELTAKKDKDDKCYYDDFGYNIIAENNDIGKIHKCDSKYTSIYCVCKRKNVDVCKKKLFKYFIDILNKHIIIDYDNMHWEKSEINDDSMFEIIL